MLLQAHEELGNQWTEIAKRLPGRTDNNVKVHTYIHSGGTYIHAW